MVFALHTALLPCCCFLHLAGLLPVDWCHYTICSCWYDEVAETACTVPFYFVTITTNWLLIFQSILFLVAVATMCCSLHCYSCTCSSWLFLLAFFPGKICTNVMMHSIGLPGILDIFMLMWFASIMVEAEGDSCSPSLSLSLHHATIPTPSSNLWLTHIELQCDSIEVFDLHIKVSLDREPHDFNLLMTVYYYSLSFLLSCMLLLII